jgi:two-component system alkaline phosphatase synthesis response regulator PhoP
MKNEDIKILLVDDELDILEFIEYNLTKENYQVLTASNGYDAIKTAEKHNPHLIILDIMMPGLDGVEVCRELRSKTQFKDTIIAFLTARSEDYSQIAGFEVGGDDYITKPIRPRVLLSRVGALLRRLSDSSTNTKGANDVILKVGDLVIDKEKILVYKNDDAITLAKKGI